MANGRTLQASAVSIGSTIRDALRAIERGEIGTAFVVDGRNKMRGIVSDGDIRRALLRGSALSDGISGIMTRKFVSMRKGGDYSKILPKLNSAIRIVPILDRAGRIVDFIKYDPNIRIPIISPDLKGNELAYLTDAFLSTWISSTGEYIGRFEKGFARFCGAKYGVAVSNGTVALELAMTALGIGPGDEVIVPDFTFAASANAVLHTGAKPVLVDIRADDWTVDPREIEKAITPRTRAIMPVHIYGQPCDMKEISRIARKHKLRVVEDCAEAHGAEFNGMKVGSIGDVGCFSFFANKVITTGEGGMCVTDSRKLYEKMRILRDHGMSKTRKYWHEAVGFNHRMTNLQAAIGCAQLEKIGRILDERSAVEEAYRRSFKGLDFIEAQKIVSGRKKITWLVSVLMNDGLRDRHIKDLMRRHIDARPFFYSLGSMPIYKKYLFSNRNSLKISRAGINLPTHGSLGTADIYKIRDVLKSGSRTRSKKDHEETSL